MLPVGQGRLSFPSNQHWEAALGVLCSVLGSPIQWDLDTGQRVKCVTTRKINRLKLEHLSYQERLRYYVPFRLEKRKLIRIFSMCLNTWREGIQKKEPGSFQWWQGTRLVSMRTNWKTVVSLWTSGNTFYCEGDQVLAQVVQRCCGVSIPGGIQKLSGDVLGQRAVSVPAWARVLDQMASKGPFKPQPFCDLF